MKKLIKTISLLFLSLIAVFMSGCMFLGPEDPDNPDPDNLDLIKNMQGIKTCYRPVNYDFDELFTSYAKNILIGLADVYGNSSFENSWLEDPANEKTTNELFNNTILYELEPCLEDHENEAENIYYTIKKDTSWNWTFNYNEIKKDDKYLFKNFSENDCFTYEQFINVQTFEEEILNAYTEYFINPYSVALECVIYEILLGQTPTVFTIDLTNSLPIITKNGISAENYLISLKETYNKKGSYVGITAHDNNVLIEYILNNVIGEEIVNNYSFIYSAKTTDTTRYNNLQRVLNAYDYESIDPDTFNKMQGEILKLNKQFVYVKDQIDEGYIRNYITKCVLKTGKLGEDIISIFDIFPAVYYKDYSSLKFYLTDTDDPMKFIDQKEYNSFVFMPNSNEKLSSVMLGFESTNDLTIRVGARYYNNTTKSFYDQDYGKVTVKANEVFDINNLLIIDCKNENGKTTPIALEPFDNTGVLNATSEKRVTSAKINGVSSSEYFITNPSANEFGSIAVLNNEKINNSYYEIYFDVVKSASDSPNKDYSFKIGIAGIIFDS